MSEPWRTLSVILALALIASVLLLAITSGRSDSGEEASPAATTTTAVPDVTSTSLADESPETTAAGATPTGGLGGLIAVKIDNAPPARPQMGPGEATILVEVPVEGGITRFIAVLPEELSGLAGPIRSLRPVDADLLPAVASVVVSSGGRPFVVQEVVASGVDNIEAGFSSMFVSQGRPDPYDTFVDLDLLETIIDEATTPATGLPSGEIPGEGEAVTEFDLPYEGVSFRYEEATGYVRLQDGEPFEVLGVDGSGPHSMSHDIVVLMYVAERPAGYSDINGIPVSTFDVIGSGDLIVHVAGEQFAGTWSRSAHADPYLFRGPSGESFGLPEGSIYVALIPRQAGETDSGE